MSFLENKIPPPLFAIIVAIAMWCTSMLSPALHVPFEPHVFLAAFVACVGGVFAAAGAISFWRAKTAVNALKPASASSLVTSGVYRITRNPMYVGSLFALIGWAIFLSNLSTILGPVLFMLYIHRFQIIPEQRALSAKFGQAYTDYARRVRPWL